MYAYLDRRPSELPHNARIAVMALRLWAVAMRARDNPLPPLETLLGRWDVAGALWPAHGLFMWIGAHARRTLLLGCPTCGAVSEDEALLLSVIFTHACAQSGAVYPALCSILRDEAVSRGALLAQRLRAEFGSASFHADSPKSNLSASQPPAPWSDPSQKLH